MENPNVDPDERIIAPNGLPLTIIIISSIFLGLSILAVSLRTYVRLKKGTFGLDDAFVGAGTVRYVCQIRSPSTKHLLRLCTHWSPD